MTYKPVYTTNDLPPERQPFPEGLRFDLKTELPKDVLASDAKLDDLACDLAAFANTQGGVILVGANEHPPGILGGYIPMSQAEAGTVKDIYEKRARKLCSPMPVVDARPIDRGGDKWVVAVNVDAYAAPPIGVMPANTSGNDRPRWWAFPIRRGTDNVPMRPEELATIMDPRLRRLVLQLERYASTASAGRFPLIWLSGTTGTGVDCTLLGLDPDAGTMTVQFVMSPTTEMILPLDLVQAVWQDAQHAFCINIRGKFIKQGSLWQFLPTGS